MKEMEKRDEKKVKDNIVDKILEISKKISQVRENIENFINVIGIQEQVPNLAITVNNKMVEIQQQFKKANISIFPQEYENGKYAGWSFLGNAIIDDLTDYLNRGMHCLDKYDKKMLEIEKRENERNVEEQSEKLEKTSPIKRFFSKFRHKNEQESSTVIYYFTEDDINDIALNLSDYTKVNETVFDYTLKENAIPSLVKLIKAQRYGANTVPELVEEEIVPELQKLGLEDLIPQLQETLIEEYKKDLTDSDKEKIKQEDMYLYVPDFNRSKESNKFYNFSSLFGEDDYRAGLRVDVHSVTSEQKEPIEYKSKDQKKEKDDLEK